jgi:uncharacterized protein
MFQIDLALAAQLCTFPEVAAAWLFGSEVRNEATPESDVDVALLLRNRGQKASDAYLLLGRIAATLERAVPGRTIDLILIESQGPTFQHRVLSEGRLIYEANRERRVDFESDAYVRYFDFRPTAQLAERHALDGFENWLSSKS